MPRVGTIASRVVRIGIAGIVCLTLSSVPVGVSGAAPGNGRGSFDPPAVYLTWQHDPTTTMTIQWHSGAEKGDTVQYRRVDEMGWHSAVGSHHALPHSDRVVHVAELTNLEPGSDYQFRFGKNSVAFTFRTMPRDVSTPIRFVVGGDTMEPLDMLGEWFQETCRQAAKQSPMFAVIGGDIAYANGNPRSVKRWFRWLAGWKRHMVTPDGRLIPVLVAIGNHEVRGGFGQVPDKAPFFYSLFATPGRRGYRVLDFGRYLSVVVLDSDHTHTIGGAQTDWLRRTLAERQDVPHLFVVYHVPAYPSNRPFTYSVGTKIRQHWVPLFERFGVDVAFEHHDHVYKRTYPIRGGRVDPQGVLYLGDGAWGVLPRRPRKNWYLAKTASTRHFILVTVDSRSRSFLAIDDEGHVFDRVNQSVSSDPMPPGERRARTVVSHRGDSLPRDARGHRR
ncbi:MAG: purple acid phosphatase family protein [Candidatus Methylomirabilales bacterium]